MIKLLQTTRKPDISFHENGRIDITAIISKMLNLAEGDIIDIAIDEEEYYIYVKSKAHAISGRHEGQLRPTNKGRRQNNLRTYSVRICRHILPRNCKKTSYYVGYPLEHPQLGLAAPIITRNPIIHD